MFTGFDPWILIAVSPSTVSPELAVRRPPRVSLSPAVAVVIVVVPSSLEKYPTVPSLEPVISPEQDRFPVEFSMVHPVDCDPPPISIFPVEVLPIWTIPVVPPSKVRFELPPAAMDPCEANARLVGVILMVSILDTPVRAPPVETLSPVDDRENVPAVFPIPTFPVPVPRSTFDVPSTVKDPEP